MLGPVSVVLQLGNVVVEIQRVWIRVSTANSHVFAVQNLLHRNFHLLARVSILRTPHQHATNGHEPKFYVVRQNRLQRPPETLLYSLPL